MCILQLNLVRSQGRIEFSFPFSVMCSFNLRNTSDSKYSKFLGKRVCARRNDLNAESNEFFITFCECPRDFWRQLPGMKFEGYKVFSFNQWDSWGFQGPWLWWWQNFLHKLTLRWGRFSCSYHIEVHMSDTVYVSPAISSVCEYMRLWVLYNAKATAFWLVFC